MKFFLTLSLLRCAIFGCCQDKLECRCRCRWNANASGRAPVPFRAYYGNYNWCSSSAENENVLISVCRRRLASVQSRPDSGSQTSGRAG